MAKLKTKRAAAKRFKVTGKGLIMRRKSHARHLLTKKSSKRKRNLRKEERVSQVEVKQVKRMLG